MKCFFLFTLCALLAPFVLAQTTSWIMQKSVDSGAAQMFLYDVDHGATAQSITVTVNINTQSNSGLRIRIIDPDNKSIGGTNDEAEGAHAGQGSLIVSLSLESRTGAHPVLVIVQTHTPGTSDLNGQVTIDVGSINATSTNQSFRAQEGLFIPFGLYAAFNGDMTTQSSFSTTITVDFGLTPHTTTFEFDGEGSALNEIRLYDVTGGDQLIETLTAGPTGTLDTHTSVTTASYSGEVTFRIEVEGDGSMGGVFWATWMQSDVEVTGGSGDGVPNPGSGGGSSGSSGGGCTTGGHAVPWLLFLLAIGVAAFHCVAQRR